MLVDGNMATVPTSCMKLHLGESPGTKLLPHQVMPGSRVTIPVLPIISACCKI